MYKKTSTTKRIRFGVKTIQQVKDYIAQNVMNVTLAHNDPPVWCVYAITLLDNQDGLAWRDTRICFETGIIKKKIQGFTNEYCQLDAILFKPKEMTDEDFKILNAAFDCLTPNESLDPQFYLICGGPGTLP